MLHTNRRSISLLNIFAFITSCGILAYGDSECSHDVICYKDDSDIGRTCPKLPTALENIISVKNNTLSMNRNRHWLIEKLCEPILIEDINKIFFPDIGIIYIKPGVFSGQEEPFKLELAFNYLEEVEVGVFSNTNIELLSLKYNRIQNIDSHAFDNMPHLRKLDIDDNRIKEWQSDWFANSPNILYVNIMDNQLTTIPAHALKNFNGSARIKLSFTNNSIYSIHPEAFVDQTRIFYIILNKNNLRNISPDVFGHIQWMSFMQIMENPLECPSNATLESWRHIEAITASRAHFSDECRRHMLNIMYAIGNYMSFY